MKIGTRFFKILSLLLILLLEATYTYAQGPGDPLCDPADPVCPIDDYYWVLIIAIIALAIYKAFKTPAFIKA